MFSGVFSQNGFILRVDTLFKRFMFSSVHARNGVSHGGYIDWWVHTQGIIAQDSTCLEYIHYQRVTC